MVIPAYRAASDRGQVELATSPFYHPILPLLCDSDVHLRAHPGAARPKQRFARPEDARAQITRAIAFHERMFGRPPAGMWPSEGSVSDEAIALMAEAGIKWIATDEDILSRSLNVALPRDGYGHAERPDVLYRAVPRRREWTGGVLSRSHAVGPHRLSLSVVGFRRRRARFHRARARSGPALQRWPPAGKSAPSP